MPDITSHAASCLFVPWILSFIVQVVVTPAIPFLNSWTFLCYWGSIQKCSSTPSPQRVLLHHFQVFSYGPWAILNWLLSRVRDVELISFFYRWPLTFTRTIRWKDWACCYCYCGFFFLPFSSACFWCFSQYLRVYSCTVLSLGSAGCKDGLCFFLIPLSICFCHCGCVI